MAQDTPITGASPLDDFSQCHAGIVTELNLLGGLPALLDAAAQARRTAARAVDFFSRAVFEHHADEERELFPAVRQHAQAGDERRSVDALVDQLVAEHRRIEAAWRSLEPALKAAARGHEAAVDATAVATLVADYRAHAAFEESVFLPLAQVILSRGGAHLAALGLSLHTRHAMAELALSTGFHV